MKDIYFVIVDNKVNFVGINYPPDWYFEEIKEDKFSLFKLSDYVDLEKWRLLWDQLN